MKRYTALIACFLLASEAFAQFGAARVDLYDAVTGLYFRSVTEKPSRGRVFNGKSDGPAVVNLNIYDPASNSSVVLFKQPPPTPISIVLFETGFKDGSLEFNPPLPFGHILNNSGIESRPLKDKLLVGLRDDKGYVSSLWTSDKRGNGLARIAVVPEGADWHIDVRNSKIRVVRQVDQGIQIESYEW